eukprot:PhF_6_TR21968/c0_g1_i1/m.31238
MYCTPRSLRCSICRTRGVKVTCPSCPRKYCSHQCFDVDRNHSHEDNDIPTNSTVSSSEAYHIAHDQTLLTERSARRHRQEAGEGDGDLTEESEHESIYEDSPWYVHEDVLRVQYPKGPWWQSLIVKPFCAGFFGVLGVMLGRTIVHGRR